MKDVGAAIRRHWPIALVIMLVIPIVVAAYLAKRDVTRPPAVYTTSADVLIPARTDDPQEQPTTAPPVLLQGQTELALASSTRSVALRSAKLDPDQPSGVTFGARLSPTAEIMTLSISAARPELAKTVLDEYVIAFQEARRQAVLDAALEQQDIQSRTIRILDRKLAQIEGKLFALGVPLPAPVPDGTAIPGAESVPIDTSLLLYQRNAILNERVSRQVDYSRQSTLAIIPGDYTTVVQVRSASRVTPPPPSPLIPLLEIIGIGLLLVVLVPVLIDRFDRSITDARGAASALRARLLGSIPAIPRRLHRGFAPRGTSWDAAFRSLAATSISTDNLPKAIMVSSPVGSIQDTVAANFATSLAQLGVKVALIGTVPRQRWYASPNGSADEGEYEEYADYEDKPVLNGQGDDPSGTDSPEEGTQGDGAPEGTAPGSEEPAVPPTPPEMPTTELPATDAVVRHPNFIDLLEEAQGGRLNGDLRSMLATIDVPNLYVVPPGEETELTLDGLPPLLNALTRDGIDVVVIGGPALLEDPNATIIAWSTRNVLWAVEIGHVDARDAQLAADRLDIAGVEPFGIALVNRHM
jgi:hypothetical protein